jgi:RNA polymerase sigma-70 factor (ECF subfamily)
MASANTEIPVDPQPEAIVELFHALEGPLLSYAMRLNADNALAQDLVQEAFLRLHRQFNDVREPRSWLYRTVHNLALNHRRHADRTVPLPASPNDPADCGHTPPEPADPQPLPDEQIARWEGVGLVRLTLQNLDARSREVVRLKFAEQLSYQEISARTGLSSGHVGYVLHHALKTMARELAKAGLVP